MLFPAYAEITSQRLKALDLAFTKVFSIALLTIVTIAGSLFMLAGEVVQLLFGSRWTTAGTVLRILALVIPLRGFSLLVSIFFWGLNRPKDVAVSTTFEALIFLAALYPLITTFGYPGAAWAGMIAYGFGCVSRIRALSRVIPGISTKLFQFHYLSSRLLGRAADCLAYLEICCITAATSNIWWSALRDHSPGDFAVVQT